MEFVYKHDIDGSVMERRVPSIDLSGYLMMGWVLEYLEPIAVIEPSTDASRKRSATNAATTTAA
jgi:hypothetical protein